MGDEQCELSKFKRMWNVSEGVSSQEIHFDNSTGSSSLWKTQPVSRDISEDLCRKEYNIHSPFRLTLTRKLTLLAVCFEGRIRLYEY